MSFNISLLHFSECAGILSACNATHLISISCTSVCLTASAIITSKLQQTAAAWANFQECPNGCSSEQGFVARVAGNL